MVFHNVILTYHLFFNIYKKLLISPILLVFHSICVNSVFIHFLSKTSSDHLSIKFQNSFEKILNMASKKLYTSWNLFSELCHHVTFKDKEISSSLSIKLCSLSISTNSCIHFLLLVHSAEGILLICHQTLFGRSSIDITFQVLILL
ncbi:MAG: hypothetical protein BWY04_00037 [candidate division CPR1 bacterium ADurb.Bin160]|uniref:Uncharacterized protein n=1 Tax=candidate division CPR1 bacterium ADurb.Bin160 TaxID=1852826 RepID=A0A1V5ZRA5_9BACT|nr:MAG: hypothetical protein BWY04_00037 [candidate division CPR1 bacterium ADurb.Bin160]